MTGNKAKKPISTIKIKRARLDVFVLFVAIFTLGIIVAAVLHQGFPKTFLLIGLSFYGFCHYAKNSKLMSLALLVAVFFISLFYGSLRILPSVPAKNVEKLVGLTGTLKGQLTKTHKKSSFKESSFNLTNPVFYTHDENKGTPKDVFKIPGIITCKATSQVFSPDFNLEIGQTYMFYGTFLFSHDAGLHLRVNRVQEICSTGLITDLARKARQGIKQSILRTLPPKYAGLIIGFILGDSSQIQENERELFTKTGLNHLLAVSGQHILILILMLSAFLYILRVPPVSRVIINTIILSFYALITVGSPSVWRALIMYVSAAISMHLESYFSPLKSVALAAFIILLYNPSAILDVSFQLSFAAVLSIVAFNEPILTFIRLFKLPGPINNYLAISLAANIGIMPISAFVFGTVPLSALIINPLILWAFAFIIPMSFVVTIIVYFKASLMLYLVPSLALIMESVIMVLKWGAAIPRQQVQFEQIPAFAVSLAYLLMFGVTAYHNKFLIWRTIKAHRNNLTRPTLITIEDHELTQDMEAYEELLRNLDDKPSVHPPIRMYYPLKNIEFIKEMDEILLSCKRPSIKDLPQNPENTIPLKRLRLENQNLFYALETLNQTMLHNDTNRIIQSQFFIMSLVGSEFLRRIPFHLTPAPNIAQMRPEYKAQDKNMQIVLLTDLVLNSSLLTRTKNHDLMSLISRLQNLYSRSCNQFERISVGGELEETLRLHFILRTDMLKWCEEFIYFDAEIKEKNQKS